MLLSLDPYNKTQAIFKFFFIFQRVSSSRHYIIIGTPSHALMTQNVWPKAVDWAKYGSLCMPDLFAYSESAYWLCL